MASTHGALAHIRQTSFHGVAGYLRILFALRRFARSVRIRNRTAFETIETQFGMSEAEVIKLMKKPLKRSSFQLWRTGVTGRKKSICRSG